MQVVRSLVCHGHVSMAIACLQSLLQCSAEPLRLVLHDDGSLTAEDSKLLLENLSPASILPRDEADAVCESALKVYPLCARFRRENILSRKLIDFPLLNGEGDLAHCDTDIFFFRKFTGLFRWPDSSTSVLFMGDSQNGYSLRPWHLLGGQAVSVPQRLNSGLMFVRRRAVDWNFLEWFLARNPSVFQRIPGWVEQTAWAALACRAGCRMWNPAQLRVIEGEQSLKDDLLAAHFTSDVRRFLSAGMKKSDGSRPPEIISTVSSAKLGAMELAVAQGRRWMRRFQRD
jgi:hypothetical protein